MKMSKSKAFFRFIDGKKIPNEAVRLEDEMVTGINMYKLSEDTAQILLSSPYINKIRKLYYYTKGESKFDFLQEMPDLTHLSIITPNAHISSIPPEILEKEKLQVLDISGTGLEKINPEIRQLTNLECLGLGTNFLQELPPTIGELIKLRHLYLYNNDIRQIPASLGDIPTLELVGLGRNPISQIPSSLINHPCAYIRTDFGIDNQKRYRSSSYCYYFLGKSPIKTPTYKDDPLIKVG